MKKKDLTLAELQVDYQRLSDAHDDRPTRGTRAAANAAYTVWQKAKEKLNDAKRKQFKKV